MVQLLWLWLKIDSSKEEHLCLWIVASLPKTSFFLMGDKFRLIHWLHTEFYIQRDKFITLMWSRWSLNNIFLKNHFWLLSKWPAITDFYLIGHSASNLGAFCYSRCKVTDLFQPTIMLFVLPAFEGASQLTISKSVCFCFTLSPCSSLYLFAFSCSCICFLNLN